jgi:DNA-directed RNA polymerase subunit RPC12/RpoP
MVEFKCIYCGQQLSTDDNNRGRSGRCPLCNHDVFVPKIAAEKSTVSTGFSKKPILSSLYIRDDDWAELYKEFFPAYDELTLFLTAFTLIMLFIANASLRELIHKLWIIAPNSLFIYLGPAIFLCGFALSIYHFYSTREKTDFEKWVMFVFAIGTNICTAVIAGIYMLRESAGWVIIFPIWNLFNAVLMILMNMFLIDQHCTTIYRYCITDRQATYHQTIISLTAVFLIFAFCNFVFNLHWAVTFSICIAYTTSFDKALQSVFPRLSSQSDEQSS